ncbi:ArsR/SmtB family transcription factor [Spirillospora albida]|uniref:ArsR/SmtB family transcription factor n=1 Tax=Spirillospora albida TaxID=58123 RepID=UPI0004BFFC98|nr:metalloregulator ArsR/SmtB family transcription factor [Spirillospora albida]
MTSAKAQVYEGFARIGKALSNPSRLELLDVLAQGERSVEELAAATGMRTSNTSAQLKELTRAGLAVSRRSGTRVRYRLADPRVAVLVEDAKRLAHARLPDVRQAARDWLGDPAALEPVTRDELAARLADGVVVLDVRPPAEYAGGHIPGALNIPADRLADRLTELPHGTDIVAYCRGRFCLMSLDAVRLLRARGHRARPLDGGIPEWRAAGHPTTVPAP